jgi:hypothetical protein
MGHLCRQKEHFPFFDLHLFYLAFIDNLQGDIPFDLIKKFLARIIVEVFPRIGSAYNHDDKIIISLIDDLISDRGLEQVTVFFDPLLKIDRFGNGHFFIGLKKKTTDD